MAESVVIPPGTYRGTVEGIESGHCTARMEVRAAPGGCVTVDYEAVSDKHGLQHVEHAILAPDSLHVAFGEAPGVTVFRGVAEGEFRSPDGMRILVAYAAGVLTWAWHWGAEADSVVERSRATCRLAEW